MDIDGVFYCSRCMRGIEREDLCPHCGHDPKHYREDPRYLPEGAYLRDRYILGAVIGSGGFGVTYAAWDDNLGVPAAIKEYFPRDFAMRNIESTENPMEVLPAGDQQVPFRLGLNRFRDEARVLAQFKNVTGIVNINECFEENGTFYIAMEYVRGVALDEYVKAHSPGAGTLLKMMEQPITALEAVHRQGIHHRDITPRNLLVQPDGSIKLIDFGSAREFRHLTNLIVVSDGYAPVEQYDLQRPQGPWGDIYSLSATLYHMLTGEMPPVSIGRLNHDTLKSPSELGIRLKKHQEKALMGGLAADPEKRIRSLEEFKSLLYNLPLPDEVRRRKAFIRRVYTFAACMVALMALVIFNFTCGLPLGDGLLYSLYPDGLHATGAIRLQSKLVFPESRLGIPVTQVGAGAFSGCEALEEVTLPGSVRCVGDMAFLRCENLRMVTIQEGVREIGFLSFADCPQLHTANIPIGIAAIADNAFTGAWERFMVWGKDNSYAESYAEAHSLPFSVRADYTVTPVEDGVELYHDWFSKAMPIYNEVIDSELQDIGGGTDIIVYFEEYVLPSYVDGYPVVALRKDFSLPSATRIVMPYYLESLPDVEDGMFGSGVESVDLGQRLEAIPDGAFIDASVSTVKIPETVKKIGDGAFLWNPLTEVILPEGLKCIDGSAFAHTYLNKIDLPDGLEIIGPGAFADTALFDVDIPDSIQKIGERAFADLRNIVNIRLKIDLDKLSPFTFAGCSDTTSVFIIAEEGDPESPSSGVIPESCFAEGGHYFVTLLGAVKKIDKYCFENSSELTYVTLPEGLEIIEERAFANCPLQEIAIPDSIVFIHPTAFEGCSPRIIGSPDSYAEQYAREHGFAFTPGLGYLKEIYGYAALEDTDNSIMRILKEEYGDSVVDKYGIPNLDMIEKAYRRLNFYTPDRSSHSEMELIDYYCSPMVVDAGDLGFFTMHQADLDRKADEGDLKSSYLLGLCYYYGCNYFDQNDEMAEEYVRRAAEAGYAPAQNRLGEWYATGNVVGKDSSVALEWFTLAAEQGNKEAAEWQKKLQTEF